MERTYSLVERLMALGLAVGFLLAVYSMVALPTREAFRQLDDEIVFSKERLFQLYQQRGNLEALDRMRRTLAEEDAGGSGRIVAANRNLARAAMQASARQLIQGQGGTVSTVRALVNVEGKEKRVMVRLKFQITQKRLPHLLVSLVNARPLLFVEHINIRTVNRNWGNGDHLVAKLDLSAYFSSRKAGG